MTPPIDPGARNLGVHDPGTGYAAFVLTGNALAAEELVQDTMVRLLPRWARVEAAEVPIAYVRRVLANQYVNQRRRASRREFAYADVPDHADDHDPVAQLADRDQIWSGLTCLPERQRVAPRAALLRGPQRHRHRGLPGRPGRHGAQPDQSRARRFARR